MLRKRVSILSLVMLRLIYSLYEGQKRVKLPDQLDAVASPVVKLVKPVLSTRASPFLVKSPALFVSASVFSFRCVVCVFVCVHRPPTMSLRDISKL